MRRHVRFENSQPTAIARLFASRPSLTSSANVLPKPIAICEPRPATSRQPRTYAAKKQSTCLFWTMPFLQKAMRQPILMVWERTAAHTCDECELATNRAGRSPVPRKWLPQAGTHSATAEDLTTPPCRPLFVWLSPWRLHQLRSACFPRPASPAADARVCKEAGTMCQPTFM